MKHSSPYTFSIRTMLSAALIVAIVVSILANIHRNGRQQRHAVSNLLGRGWIVKYDVDVDTTLMASVKRWISIIAGKDNVCSVHTVSAVNDTVPTDDDLITVGELQTVRSIYVLSWQSRIGDDGVCALSQLETLEIVVIHNTVLSNIALECLSKNPRLKALTFDELENLTDETLVIIGRFQALQELNVSDRGLSKDDVKRIQCEIDIETVRIWSAEDSRL